MKNKKTKLFKKTFGKELILDLYDCDSKILCSRRKILEYSDKICRLGKFKKYGKPFIERFGFNRDFTVGFSLVQLIESSSITGHFSELWGRAYINIFSCKFFNHGSLAKFTKRFFRAKKIISKVLRR